MIPDPLQLPRISCILLVLHVTGENSDEEGRAEEAGVYTFVLN